MTDSQVLIFLVDFISLSEYIEFMKLFIFTFLLRISNVALENNYENAVYETGGYNYIDSQNYRFRFNKPWGLFTASDTR